VRGTSFGVRDRAARLRLSVHVLHCSDDARAGAEPQVGGRGARGDGPRARRHHRGDAPWPDVNSYTDGAHDFADLLRAWAKSRACGGCGSRRPTHGLHRPRGRGHGGDRCGVRARALPVQSGSSRVLKRMLRRYDRARYLEVVARCAAPSRALPSPPTSSWIPGETEEDFRTRCHSSSRWSSTTPIPSSTRRARGRPRPGSRMLCPTPCRGSGWSVWLPRCEPSRAAATSPGRQHPRSVGRGARQAR